MDKMMDNPWFLRIIALTLAILLFVSVKNDLEKNELNTSGTQIDVLRDVPVEVYYDDDNLVVTGVPETVTVNIEGPSQIVLSAKMMKDYKLFVDLRELSIGEHRVAISSENFSEKLKVRIDPVYVNVVIEERISREFRVDPDMNEGLLAENYIVKSYDVEPKVITITGAKSIINSIGYVKATIEGEQGISKSFEQEANVRVLDRDLNKLDVLIEPRSVQVKVKIEEYSKEIPIVLEQKGSPKEGVTINRVYTNAEFVRVYGPRTVVDKLKNIPVDVDVSKIEKSGEFDAKIIIPDGVTKLSTDKIKVIGDVSVAPTTTTDTDSQEEELTDETVSTVEEEKSFVDVEVKVKGLPNSFASTFISPEDGLVSVVAKGTPEALDKITANNIELYVEADEAKLGEQTFPIKMSAPSEVTWVMTSSEATLNITEV